MKPRFILLGAAGFVAPRHLAAIKHVGGELVAVMDPHDSVGILDSFFPDCLYFREAFALDRFVDKERRAGRPIDWCVIATPNYLHESQARWAMRSGMDVICEKPLCLNPDNIAGIEEVEIETGKRVFCCLQLRYHPGLDHVEPTDMNEAGVIYWVARGPWYEQSWKGSDPHSGGILMNIAVHYFDLVLHLFGGKYVIAWSDPGGGKGRLEWPDAIFEWEFGIRSEDPVREFTINGQTIDLSEGLRTLHNAVYEHAMKGEGARPADCRPALELVRRLRDGTS